MSRNTLKEIGEWVISLAIAAILAIVIKSFIFDVIPISGPSMESTLMDRDRVAVEKISLYTHKLKRGEIITFDPGNGIKDTYIKRIIGLPGDNIKIKDGRVYVNGRVLSEPYLNTGTQTNPGEDSYTSLVVPDGCIYVLGDNREISEDSRYLGPIQIKSLKGHAILRIYPFSGIRTF